MRCPNCKSENPDVAKFCHKCGAALRESIPTKVIPPPEQAKESPPSAVPKPSVHSDTTCPYCGSSNCQPMARNVTKVKGSSYSMTNGCCGLCLMGPFGLLCGLCGTGTRVDVKNETAWICQDCGKEHLSQKDAKEKALAMALTAFVLTLIGSWLLSASVLYESLTLLRVLLFAGIPLGAWLMIEVDLSNELGYPFGELIDPQQKKAVLIGLAVVVVLMLLFSGSIVDSWLSS